MGRDGFWFWYNKALVLRSIVAVSVVANLCNFSYIFMLLKIYKWYKFICAEIAKTMMKYWFKGFI